MNNLNSQTIVAFARLAVTLVLSVAAAFGWALDWGLVYNVIVSALGLAMLTWAWWKNNNVTEAAQESQLLLDEIKENGRIDVARKSQALADKAEEAVRKSNGR